LLFFVLPDLYSGHAATSALKRSWFSVSNYFSNRIHRKERIEFVILLCYRESMKKAYMLPVSLVMFCLFATNVYGLRCGNDIVDVGDPKIEVLRKCGKPDIVDRWDEEQGLLGSTANRIGEGRSIRAFINVEQWTYNFGPTRFLYILTFKNGILTEIKTGNKGF
jgi:hypothetical protein